MVKSPWKLLTGLLSRGKIAVQGDAGQASATVPEAAIGGEPASEPKPSAASQAVKGETSDHQALLPSMAADLPETILTDEATALAWERTVVIVGAKRRNQQGKVLSATRRKPKTKASLQSRGAEPFIVLAEKTAANEPNPVHALNGEIQDLRSQLAVKLRLQNDQLRQMLRRFEPK